MATGPVYPFSTDFITADKIFEGRYVRTGGTQNVNVIGIGVMASLDADAIARLLFQVPDPLPSGTAKLFLKAIAPATSGVARINPKWRFSAMDVSLEDNAVAAESVTPSARTGGGSTDSLQWETGDDERFLRGKWNLDAAGGGTIAAGGVILMDLTFETASWTLASQLVCIPELWWE